MCPAVQLLPEQHCCVICYISTLKADAHQEVELSSSADIFASILINGGEN